MLCPQCQGTGEITLPRLNPDTLSPLAIECPCCEGEGEIDIANDEPDFDPLDDGDQAYDTWKDNQLTG